MTAVAGGVAMSSSKKTDQADVKSSAARNADNGTGCHDNERKIYNCLKMSL